MSSADLPQPGRVVATVPSADDAEQRRRAALDAWLRAARDQGHDARPLEDAGERPADERYVADVEVGATRLRLELRDRGRKVVVGWLR